jgi:hypothetical protein
MAHPPAHSPGGPPAVGGRQALRRVTLRDPVKEAHEGLALVDSSALRKGFLRTGSDSTALPKSGAHPRVVSQTNAITERVMGHDRLNGTMRTHVNPAFRSAMNELRQLFLKVAGDFSRRFEMCDKSPIATSARLDMSVFEYKCLNTMEGKHGSAGVRAQAQ